MANFVNTIDLLGDEAVTKALVERTIPEFNDDVIKTVGLSAFSNCTALTSVDLPNVTNIGQNSFSSCSNLKTVNVPKLINGNAGMFNGCYALERIDMHGVVRLQNSIFYGCTALKIVVFRYESLVQLQATGTFQNTPFYSNGTGGTFLFPRSLVESYKTATNWSVYWGYGHNRFLALEDYTVDGTITGAIDWDKLGGTT